MYDLDRAREVIHGPYMAEQNSQPVQRMSHRDNVTGVDGVDGSDGIDGMHTPNMEGWKVPPGDLMALRVASRPNREAINARARRPGARRTSRGWLATREPKIGLMQIPPSHVAK